MIIFPPSNLPVVSQRWGNQIQNQINVLQSMIDDLNNNSNNVNKAQNGTMQVLGNKIANVQTLINTALTGITIDASAIVSGTLTRPVASPGTITAAGSITAGNNLNATNGVSGGDLYTANGPGFNITGGRVTAWLETATGRVGMATSSERYKTAIEDATTDPEAILGISVKYYQAIAEVAKRDDPNSESYIGPQYHVSVNIGMIAEDLHAAGLWEFVVYQRDENDNLVLDENGNPIPDGIHYEIFALAVLVATQYVNTRLTALEERVTTLEGKA